MRPALTWAYVHIPTYCDFPSKALRQVAFAGFSQGSMIAALAGLEAREHRVLSLLPASRFCEFLRYEQEPQLHMPPVMAFAGPCAMRSCHDHVLVYPSGVL